VDHAAQQLAVRVVRLLGANGHQAWLVGGCVRDLLLGIPATDFDVSTDARPERVLQLFPGARKVGAHFGVVLVVEGGAQVEVATFRSDHSYSDHRRPDRVEFETSAERDVLRRDFTINALLLDPESGEVRDYVGGRDDLSRRVVRAIGDPERRFGEDYLRMLRAVRFAARLGFVLDEDTARAIGRMRSLVHGVAAERVRDEVTRILTEGGARHGFELLDSTGLLTEILPEVSAMKGVAQPPEFHPEGDVWTHTLLMLERLPAGVSPELALGVLLHDAGKPSTFRAAARIRFDGHVEAGVMAARRILERLRFSHDECRQVLALVENHMKFKDVPAMRESTLKRFLRMERFDEHLELHRLDCLASHGHLETYEFVRTRLGQLSSEQIRPLRLIGGRDLIGAGYTPGPAFATTLQAVEDAQLEGRIQTRDEALELARQLLGPD